MSDTLDLVLELETRRRAAIIAGDEATMCELMDEGCAYTHSNGMFDTRASLMEGISSGRLRYREIDCQYEQVREYDATVLITGRVALEVTAMGRDLSLRSRATIVWAKADGEWKFVAWQSTSEPAA